MEWSLPTESDINVYDSLDERCAVKNFLGKGLDAAEALFRENALYYMEDLMSMGPVAFGFYVQAAIRYLLSPAAIHDCSAVSLFYWTVRFRQDNEPELIAELAPALRGAVSEILSNFEQYDVSVEAYGDLEEKYRRLLKRLSL